MNFGANLESLDPTEELILCTLQLWGLVVSQLRPGYGGGAGGGHGGHDGEEEDEEEDTGIDMVPVRSGTGSGGEEDESSEEENEEEYFMLDPTLQLGAVRPVYPMATQHVIQLCLHVMQWYLSTSDEGQGALVYLIFIFLLDSFVQVQAHFFFFFFFFFSSIPLSSLFSLLSSLFSLLSSLSLAQGRCVHVTWRR